MNIINQVYIMRKRFHDDDILKLINILEDEKDRRLKCQEQKIPHS